MDKSQTQPQQPQPTEEHSVSCSEPENMIRVTLSIMVKRHIRGGNNRIGSDGYTSGNGRRGKYE